MLLTAPNGATVDASDEAAANLLANGFSRPVEPKPKPKAAPRKRAAKPKTKEQ